MWLLTLILLILVGLLGIAPWLKQRQPSSQQPLGQLETIEGWIGVAGLIWGLFLLLRWIGTLNALGAYGFGHALGLLVTALVIAAASLLLALPLLRSLLGENGFTRGLGRLTDHLMPYRIGLGFACLVLAVLVLLQAAF